MRANESIERELELRMRARLQKIIAIKHRLRYKSATLLPGGIDNGVGVSTLSTLNLLPLLRS
jgi:hypothetical protein